MTWDSNTLAQDIAPNTSVSVAVIEGIGPYRWTVSGNGFYLDSGHSIKNIISESGAITIYTQNACGTGVISVSDNCSTLFFEIRSTDGQWVQVDWPQSLFTCPIRGGPDDLVSNWNFVKIQGKYKLEQNTYMRFYGHNCTENATSQCFVPGSVWAFNPINARHYSCIDNFAFGVPHGIPVIEGWVYEHDHCFWEKYNMNGWTCVKSWWAEHNKSLYEWRCL